jgi:hypothetical protein
LDFGWDEFLLVFYYPFFISYLLSVFEGKIMPGGRPSSIKSKWFNRQLSDTDKLILAAAGDGDLSKGFKNLLEIYQVLWSRGYRPRIDFEEFLYGDTNER